MCGNIDRAGIYKTLPEWEAFPILYLFSHPWRLLIFLAYKVMVKEIRPQTHHKVNWYYSFLIELIATCCLPYGVKKSL